MVEDGTGLADQLGDYEIHLAKSTGANEHGQLINGGSVSETIGLGDLDSWTLNAVAGERITLTMVDVNSTGLRPFMILYAPDGSLVIVAANNTVAEIYSRIALQTGTYTLVVEDGTGLDDQLGDYEIHLAKSTGANEHGLLEGVGTFSQQITVGDLDSYTFFGDTGDQIQLTITDVNNTLFRPFVTLYKPDGSLFISSTGLTEAGWAELGLPDSGLYTVVIEDGTGLGDQVGPYIINYNLPDVPPDPQRPVAVASTPAEVFRGETINLDGSGSFDPDNSPDPLSFNWTLVSVPVGSSITQMNITGGNQALASLVPDVSGEYRLALDVFDGLLSDITEVLVIVRNHPPIALAGLDQNAVPGDVVLLDGSASTDADGDSLTYRWVIIDAPVGSVAVLLADDTVNPTFTPDLAGNYLIGLIASDREDDSSQDTLSIVVMAENVAPNAIADFSGTLKAGEPIVLDGTQSNDPDNGPQALTFNWIFQSVPPLSGISVTSIADTSLAGFTPDVVGDYSVFLTVSDGELSDSDQRTITVSDNPCLSPLASAGSDQIIELGQLADLDGAGSTSIIDCTTIEYRWSLISVATGSDLLPTSIDSNTSLSARFLPDIAGTYVAQLRVTVGGLTNIDTLMITVTENQMPVANAGGDQLVDLGGLVNLNGTDSFDPDSGPAPLAYQWSVISAPIGSTAAVGNADNATASFIPDLVGDYQLQLSVSDGVTTDVDTALITVTETVVVQQVCDINNDQFIDIRDIRLIFASRNIPASGVNDPADWNSDGVINVLDARGCILQCSAARCAVTNNDLL